MRELVDELHLLDEVAAHAAHELAEIVGVEGRLRIDPEGHVLVASRELGEGLELGDLAVLELAQEALVLRPEEADVRDVEEHHGQALEAEAKGPARLLRAASAAEDVLLHHTAAEHLKPLVVVVDLKLEARLREGEVRVDPALLHRPEDGVHHTLERVLEIILDLLVTLHLVAALGRLEVREHAHALHLVEHGVVRRINLIAAVHVAGAKERIVTILQQRRLVGAGVAAEHGLVIDVVGIRGRPGDVVLR
mmetsp:Transcript_19792/g.59959  ORF Transcript_19792/g.59959 Transcript_19792/m.59959 type:complete len:250 (+) Transcript_19792:1089-1838(+)